MKSPLLIGGDLRNMKDEDKEILLNKDIIAVNQDRLGIQGHRYWSDKDDEKTPAVEPGALEIWACDLEGGVKAVILFNRNGKDGISFPLNFNDIGLTDGTYAEVYDMWKHEVVERTTGYYTAFNIPKHGNVMLRIKPIL